MSRYANCDLWMPVDRLFCRSLEFWGSADFGEGQVAPRHVTVGVPPLFPAASAIACSSRPRSGLAAPDHGLEQQGEGVDVAPGELMVS